nr:MAG TPA: hypothetical protein [Caudoviricetes sp.]
MLDLEFEEYEKEKITKGKDFTQVCEVCSL